MDYFFDCHCHLFNFQDIPIYGSIERYLENERRFLGRFVEAVQPRGVMKTIEKLHKIFALKEELFSNREFVLYFERSIERNIQLMVTQIDEMLIEIFKNRDAPIILTPLIMDFECITPNFLDDAPYANRQTSDISHVLSVKKQCDHLKNAISQCEDEGWYKSIERKIRIYPFIGYDPRKLKRSEGADDFLELWNSVGGMANRGSDPAGLENGTVIGIKLYPPIGFNPYPDDIDDKVQYTSFFSWCHENGVPVTVHCQPESYPKKSSGVSKNTHPDNWARLFSQEDELSEGLRINFAHFGGDKEVDDTIQHWGLEFFGKHPSWPERINKSTWTWKIIELLHKYPERAFSDISAFAFNSTGSSIGLSQLLQMSISPKNEYPELDGLADKILWGSDIPMVISADTMRRGMQEDSDSDVRPSHYKYLIEALQKTLPNQELVRKMCCDNPKRFLFG